MRYNLKWTPENFREYMILNRPELILLTDYTKYHSKVNVADSDGNVFSLIASELLRGNGVCNFRTSVDKNKYFISLARKKHNDLYTYENCNYLKNNEKVLITCKEHGDFLQIPTAHLQGQGCIKCGKKTKFTDFVEKSNIIHNFKYSYIEDGYNGVKDFVKIICNEHGEFAQKGYSHLQGHGCIACAKQINGGYKLNDWDRISKNSKNFHSYKVYIVNLFNDSENFLKIGRTFTSIKRRMRLIPYSYKILKVFEGSAKEMYDLEISLHKKFNNNTYNPKIEFRGMNECFNKNIIDGML
jgi:hypothetical protein